MVRERNLDSYEPRRRRDLDADRTQVSVTQVETITATASKFIFRAPSSVKVTLVSLVADAAVAGLNESYWTFQVLNRTKKNLTLLASAITTQNSGNGGLSSQMNYDLALDQNFYLSQGDVLVLEMTKTGSAPDITELAVIVEYEVGDGPVGDTTTSSSTTTTTTTTTTTSSSTTTTSSSTTTTSTSTTSTSSSTTTTSTSITTTSSSTTSTSSSTTTTSSSTTTTSTSSTTSTTVTTTSSSTTLSTSTTVT